MNTIRSERGRLSRAAGGSDREMDAVLSTTDVAFDGHRVLGWQLPESCPLIDTHRDLDAGVRSVIGKVTPRWTGSRLLGVLRFADADVNPDAEIAFQLCQAGFVDSVSVSFVPIDWAYASTSGRRPGAMDIKIAKLLETSIVAVGSDENARILARAIRARGTRRETSEDRRIRAEAHARRIAREDAAARARGEF
jgi:hypothetical protein